MTEGCYAPPEKIKLAAQIKFTLCVTTEDDTTNDDTTNNDTNAVPIDEAAKALEDSELPAVREQVESPNNIEDMKQKMAEYRVLAVRYAKSELDKVMTNVEELQKQIASMNRTDALKTIEEQRKKAKAVIDSIDEEASTKLEEAKKIIDKTYKSDAEILAAAEKLKKAIEECTAEYNTAEEEFKRIRHDMKGKKRTAESKHEDKLRKGRQERKDAEKSAELRWSKAKAAYTRANRRRNLSSEERKKLEKTYKEEKAIYDRSLKSAENKWQKLLDTLEIGKIIRECDEAIEKAENEKDLAEEKAKSIYKAAYDEHKKLSDEAEKKKLEAEKLAEAEYSNFQIEFRDEYNKILRILYEMKKKLR
ncbi:hypothetical protein V9T40_010107 [Parthenolecanium corni]|uniref:Uncharacterized protein n=1 Tax=Parthenolecanium corni TaxID=536013 RepID=A0AAN9TLN3_9HEMI